MNSSSEIVSANVLERQEVAHWTSQDDWLLAPHCTIYCADGKENIFDVGDRVWLLTKHFHTTKPSKKQIYNHTKPDTVCMFINENTEIIGLLTIKCNQNVLYIPQLYLSLPLDTGQPMTGPHQVIVDTSEEWDVMWFVQLKQSYWNMHSCILWPGKSNAYTCCTELATNLHNAWKWIDLVYRMLLAMQYW